MERQPYLFEETKSLASTCASFIKKQPFGWKGWDWFRLLPKYEVGSGCDIT